jgi:hypothetical protein
VGANINFVFGKKLPGGKGSVRQAVHYHIATASSFVTTVLGKVLHIFM